MQIQSYLHFDGRCEEALDFYRRALGAEVTMLMRFRDCPDPEAQRMTPAGSEDKVMHASFRVGETTVLASDGRCRGKADFKGFGLALTAADDTDAERLFAALGEGGEVQMPMSRTFFASRFGMVADRFGVCWMVLTPA